MVPPWFVHGLSIDLGVFDGETMKEPWTKYDLNYYYSVLIYVKTWRYVENVSFFDFNRIGPCDYIKALQIKGQGADFLSS
ncbi:MAG: hypothetical protein N4A37_08175 [Prolixibacteraceae bacterium]|jgi:hypothetical protein|nr:hypothetical protein [Prolixibacteraceae bacterium]